MDCPKCGASTDNNFCPECKADVLQYALIDKMSFESYNKGLTLAKENDISGAIEHLEKSIKYNSTNITALNLLGLCYDKVGRVADASKYWIRSCLVLEDNVAQDYLKVVEDKVTQREKLNESIKMYNQGLIYFRQNNLDVAIIQLKNAVDKNDNFVEAMNLLALVYMKQGERDKAIHLLKKVVKVDTKNEKALRYLEALNYKPSNFKPTAKKQKELNEPIDYVKKSKKNNNSVVNKATVASFFMGIGITILIYFVIIVPNMQSKYNNNVIDSERGFKDQINEQGSVITSKETEINNLQNQVNTLTSENEKLKQDYNKLNVYVSLDNAEAAIANKDYPAAAKEIYSIEPSAVAADQIDRYNELKATSYTNAGKSYYNSGVNLYNAQKYQEALTDLNYSVAFGGTATDYYPSTLFYIGRCYEGLGNNEEAKKYYEKIINEYPNNDNVHSAKNRLNAIS